ncbi:hypothetical protein OVA07_02920 [Novosphingobium sp. SL115]|uniref:hypothetical protein n=1 Tax=Novosphingobium sp. SL115 TaxID=2995150 RepID=UPI002275DB4A|nr:hypothetical protein [Novosphingobium sp. SL115]MCY1669960.1 hypothetical protein [Novosphingobium sp. SL115]
MATSLFMQQLSNSTADMPQSAASHFGFFAAPNMSGQGTQLAVPVNKNMDVFGPTRHNLSFCLQVVKPGVHHP